MAAEAVTKQIVALDEFGRTEAERTVVLLPRDAERVNNEVVDGDHDTYNAALAYVIERGFKEIERQRLSSIKQEGQRLKAKAMDKFTAIIEKSPKLVDNHIALVATAKATMTKAEFDAFAPMLKTLGIAV